MGEAFGRVILLNVLKNLLFGHNNFLVLTKKSCWNLR